MERYTANLKAALSSCSVDQQGVVTKFKDPVFSNSSPSTSKVKIDVSFFVPSSHMVIMLRC
jgi:hypothetical protein